MPKKFKLRPTGRRAPTKKRTSSFVKSRTQAPVEYFSRRAKVFPPLPTSLGVRQTFQTDPLYTPANTVPAIGNSFAGARASYVVVNLLDMSQTANRGGLNGSSFWHNTSHHAMCQVYQEFAYQTTYVTADFHMDSLVAESGRPFTQSCQIVAKIVPMSQIKKLFVGNPPISGPFDPPLDFGQMFSGIDYYGMLTSQPGAQHTTVTADGNRSGKALTFKVDAFEHNGNPIRGTTVIRNTTDLNSGTLLATQVQVWSQPVYPDPRQDQQVLLIAFRWAQTPESDVNRFDIRCNLRCDQHFVYSDPHMATQDLLYAPDTQRPDDR